MAHALIAAVAVLIIACACALGLVAPMSVMAATGKGATTGVLLGNAEAIESIRRQVFCSSTLVVGDHMAATESTMLALGTPAPDFRLPDVVSGQTVSLETFAGKKALLVMFICRHCPYVVHVKDELARLGRDYEAKPVGSVAISANDADNYPGDAPPSLKQMAVELDFRFPFCYDESQQTAKAYSAACTPDLFLFDEKRLLVYRGQLDGSRPGNSVPVTGRDLRAAIDAVLAGKAVDPKQKPSLGCNIKWKSRW